MRVDVVIPVHGNWHLTQRCLDSLRDRDACVTGVIVVDDASPDESAARLRERSDVRTISLAANAGFAAAVNAGAALARADAVFFLNNDTIVSPGAIARLADALQSDDTIGAVGPKLLYPDETIQSAACALMDRLTTWHLYHHLDAALPQANVAGDFPYLTGGALMVRTELLRGLGGFDEAYVNGAEDVDLCLRIWQRGFRVRYVPESEIFHFEGASRGKRHDDTGNLNRLRTRWSGAVSGAPLFRPAELPYFAAYWRDERPIDALVRAHIVRMFREYGSVRVTFASYPGAERLARIRAGLDRRRLVRLAYGADVAADARWLAPRDARAAAAARAREREQAWVPNHAARRRLLEAGIAAERIKTVRLGFFAPPEPDPNAAPAIVSDASVPGARLEGVFRALGSTRAVVVDSDDIDANRLDALRRAPLVVFAGRGDAWGFLGGERLAAGAQVVAPADAPFLEIAARDAAIAVDAERIPDAVAELRGNPQRYAELGAIARREAQLRMAALHGVDRMQELARAIVGGIPDPRALEITPQTALRLARAE
jgi:GT2 family glycosyltransferase